MEENEDIKNSQYLAIGKFLVKFEHMIEAMKYRFKFLFSMTKNIELLIKPLSARQMISVLKDLIETKEITVEEKELFKKLLKDLEKLNTKRNLLVHSTWYIGWKSKDEDLNKEIFKGRSREEFIDMTLTEIENLIVKCEEFHSLFWSLWSIDPEPISNNVPKFNEMWNRSENGNWARKDIKSK